MDKYLVWPDGHRDLLADLTEEEFILTQGWSGSSDTEYRAYLSRKGMVSLDQFEHSIEGASRAEKPWVELHQDGIDVTISLVTDPDEPQELDPYREALKRLRTAGLKKFGNQKDWVKWMNTPNVVFNSLTPNKACTTTEAVRAAIAILADT